jgi:hypothetical protein
VVLADGSTKSIDQVKVDDVVLTTDTDTGKTEQHRVVGTDVHGDEPQRTELKVTSDGKSGTVEATDWHLFWVEESGGWVAIADVQVGEHLHSPDGHTVVVAAVRHFVQTDAVYDLTVDSVHDFYISTTGSSFLVHNCGEQTYEAGGKHGPTSKSSSRGTNSAEPSNGQAALDNSVQIKASSPRRVGMSNGEVVILDRTREVPCGCTTSGGLNEIFHGHVRANIAKENGMAKAFSALKAAIRNGFIDPNG